MAAGRVCVCECADRAGRGGGQRDAREPRQGKVGADLSRLLAFPAHGGRGELRYLIHFIFHAARGEKADGKLSLLVVRNHGMAAASKLRHKSRTHQSRGSSFHVPYFIKNSCILHAKHCRVVPTVLSDSGGDDGVGQPMGWRRRRPRTALQPIGWRRRRHRTALQPMGRLEVGRGSRTRCTCRGAPPGASAWGGGREQDILPPG